MRAPYGYTRQDNGTWAVDDAVADVIVRIFGEFAAPYRHTGLTEIAHDLNVDQVVTARGGQWHASTVRYVLRNRAYAGRRPGFPAIIDQELWDAAQRRLAGLPMGPTR